MLNYPNHFCIFFLSCTFTSGTLSYSLFFHALPLLDCLTNTHGREKIRATRKRVTLRGTGWLFSSSKRLGGWIRSCWREIFSHLAKNQGLERDFRNSWDALVLRLIQRLEKWDLSAIAQSWDLNWTSGDWITHVGTEGWKGKNVIGENRMNSAYR